MRKIIFTSFLFLALLPFETVQAMAFPSQDMAHHGHAGMNHAAMVQSPEAGSGHGHTGDLRDVIPVINAHDHGNQSGGKQGGKKSCELHLVCPSDHVCEMKDHQCPAVNGFEVDQTSSISSECGGGLPLQAVPMPQHHEFILTVYLFKEFKFSSYFLPPLVEVPLAGFPGEQERPPQFSSL